MKEQIVIAGGTGMIGRKMRQYFENQGHSVRVLTRGVTQASKGMYQWDPYRQTIDPKALSECTVLINLCGEGIAEKRWTKERKQALYDSRIKTTQYLYSVAPPTLRHYISASGITCYGFDKGERLHLETDAFGLDDTAQLVQFWEHAADSFSSSCIVSKIRISVVLTRDGGALPKLEAPVKLGVGSRLGDGTQIMNWIHIDDLVGIFNHVLTHKLEGVYNAIAGNDSNAEFTQTLAEVLKKPYFFPPVPGFVMRVLFGEMADLLLKGARASNEKIKATGYSFVHEKLKSALRSLYKK